MVLQRAVFHGGFCFACFTYVSDGIAEYGVATGHGARSVRKSKRARLFESMGRGSLADVVALSGGPVPGAVASASCSIGECSLANAGEGKGLLPLPMLRSGRWNSRWLRYVWVLASSAV